MSHVRISTHRSLLSAIWVMVAKWLEHLTRDGCGYISRLGFRNIFLKEMTHEYEWYIYVKMTASHYTKTMFHHCLYNNVTSVCIFNGCWLWSIREHTHTCRWRQIHVRYVSGLVFLFPCTENPSINHITFFRVCVHTYYIFHTYYIITFKHTYYIFPCVYCNRSEKTSQCVKNSNHATRLRLVSYFLFFTRCDVICDLLQYTHMGKCYLLSTSHFLKMESEICLAGGVSITILTQDGFWKE